MSTSIRNRRSNLALLADSQPRPSDITVGAKPSSRSRAMIRLHAIGLAALASVVTACGTAAPSYDSDPSPCGASSSGASSSGASSSGGQQPSRDGTTSGAGSSRTASVPGCNAEGPSTDGNSSGGTTAGGTTYTINGLPAKEFFAQFMYEKIQRYLEGSGSFSAVNNGDSAFVMRLFLMEKGNSFTLFYTEGPGEWDAGEHIVSPRSERNRRVTGEWKLEGGKLRLGKYVLCDGMETNGVPALRCELTRAIGYEEAIGKGAHLVAAGSFGAQPSDSRWDSYR